MIYCGQIQMVKKQPFSFLDLGDLSLTHFFRFFLLSSPPLSSRRYRRMGFITERSRIFVRSRRCEAIRTFEWVGFDSEGSSTSKEEFFFLPRPSLD